MTLDFKSKKMQYFYERYQAALDRGDYTLHSVYKNPSENKQDAWLEVLKIYQNLDGHGLAVISHSAQYFTAAFMFEENHKKFFLVETPFGQYISEVKE